MIIPPKPEPQEYQPIFSDPLPFEIIEKTFKLI